MTLIILLALLHQQPTHDHHAEVDRRGDAVMGFSHEKTTHHFRLRSYGGEIEVAANDPGDTASAARIRGHLSHIAQMFRDGDFTAPLLIHARNPPGTQTMTRLKDRIAYDLEDAPGGARVRVTTTDAEALAAVHEFLRFQIADHRTGDPLTIQKE
jgi:hypothetical protein